MSRCPSTWSSRRARRPSCRPICTASPRVALVCHALDQLAPSLRDAVAAIELESAGSFVNMGLNFDRVAWRAVWRQPGLPEVSGTIPVWKGEIA